MSRDEFAHRPVAGDSASPLRSRSPARWKNTMPHRWAQPAQFRRVRSRESAHGFLSELEKLHSSLERQQLFYRPCIEDAVFFNPAALRGSNTEGDAAEIVAIMGVGIDHHMDA